MRGGRVFGGALRRRGEVSGEVGGSDIGWDKVGGLGVSERMDTLCNGRQPQLRPEGEDLVQV